ncbi:hypothetical protein CMO91_06070 [Candidatus Woesearchaeota archaeon]|nr:hypothetical protein [Candidatus Woesearchaeota archaeon]
MPSFTIAHLTGTTNRIENIEQGMAGITEGIIFLMARPGQRDWDENDIQDRSSSSLAVCTYDLEQHRWDLYTGPDNHASDNHIERRVNIVGVDVDVGLYSHPRGVFEDLGKDVVPTVIGFPSAPPKDNYRFVSQVIERFGHRKGQKVVVVPTGRKDAIDLMKRADDNRGFSFFAVSTPSKLRTEYEWQFE